MSELHQQLEPAVTDGLADPRNPPNEAIQLSIAISLKRIADALELTRDDVSYLSAHR